MENQLSEIESHLPYFLEHLNFISQQHQQIDSVLRFLKEFSPEQDIASYEEAKEQLNFNGFLTTCSLDLLVTSKNLIGAKTDWEIIYALRHGYLTIYEAIETYSFYNQWLHKAVTVKYETLEPAMKALAASLKEFRRKYNYDDTIKDIRNNVAAHIEKDFQSYFSRLSGFDYEKAKEALAAFVNILAEMQQLSGLICKQTNIAVTEKSNEVQASIQEKMEFINSRFESLWKSIKN